MNGALKYRTAWDAIGGLREFEDVGPYLVGGKWGDLYTDNPRRTKLSLAYPTQ